MVSHPSGNAGPLVYRTERPNGVPAYRWRSWTGVLFPPYSSSFLEVTAEGYEGNQEAQVVEKSQWIGNLFRYASAFFLILSTCTTTSHRQDVSVVCSRCSMIVGFSFLIRSLIEYFVAPTHFNHRRWSVPPAPYYADADANYVLQERSHKNHYLGTIYLHQRFILRY